MLLQYTNEESNETKSYHLKILGARFLTCKNSDGFLNNDNNNNKSRFHNNDTFNSSDFL